MGNLIQASCACGYRSDTLQQGMGYSFFASGRFYEAAYCDACGLLTTIDGSGTHNSCTHCKEPLTLYRPQLINAVREGGVLGYEELEAGTRWHCPACKQQRLEFTVLGLWD